MDSNEDHDLNKSVKRNPNQKSRASYMRFITAWDRVLMLLLALWLQHLEMDYTLTDNLRNHRYPINADSIGLPLIGDVLANFIATPFYLSIAFIPSARFLRLRLKKPAWWRYPLFIWLGLSYLIALLSALGFTMRWWKPFHESISVFGFGTLMILLVFLLVDLQRFIRTRRVRSQLNSDP